MSKQTNAMAISTIGVETFPDWCRSCPGSPSSMCTGRGAVYGREHVAFG
jgi:hypothetical protein